MSSAVTEFSYSKKATVNYGEIDDLRFKILVQTPTGLTWTWFLFDTGADVSMLPRSWIENLGLNLSELSCHCMTGVSGEIVKVYKSNLKIKLDENAELIEIPVAFSESDSAPQIIGKAGILNRFTITLDHKARTVSFVN